MLVLAVLAIKLALLRCPRWPPTSGKGLPISLCSCASGACNHERAGPLKYEARSSCVMW